MNLNQLALIQSAVEHATLLAVSAAQEATGVDLLLFGLYTPAWWTPNMETGLVRPGLRIDGVAA